MFDERYDRSLRNHNIMEGCFYAASLILGLLTMVVVLKANFNDKVTYLPILENLSTLYVVCTAVYAAGRQRKRHLMRSAGKPFTKRLSEFIVVMWWLIAIVIAVDVTLLHHDNNAVLSEVVWVVGLITGLFLGSEAMKIITDIFADKFGLSTGPDVAQDQPDEDASPGS